VCRTLQRSQSETHRDETDDKDDADSEKHRVAFAGHPVVDVLVVVTLLVGVAHTGHHA
jgi:hypothetical protein